jgi:hypothetical protein
MPVINGVYLKDFTALPGAVADANIIPIAISGDNVAYRTTVAGIVTDARITAKLLTGLSVTGGAIAATDTILEAFGKVQNQINSKVSSVGLTMPSAFNVANSPITSAGTLAVTAAGVASQYIRGDGALADFPTNGGGGSSVSYYLNGSVSQGTFVGNTYYEMNKTPVIGTGTDFTIGADGYIAQFITDANDPASLLIPAGNWNVEMYFSASSNGGTPSFYVEVYKYNGTTFTLLGTSSATPEGITNGTAIDIYYTSVGIPETVLTITDRLAIRVYVTHSGRTITLHTEDNHLSEIITTFSNGINTLNGLTKQAQYFAVGSTGTDFAIVSSVDTHTFNIPSASASNRGLITTGAQTIAGDKTFTGQIVIYPSSGNAYQTLIAPTSGDEAYLAFNNGVTGVWTLRKVATTNDFQIYNPALGASALSIDDATNIATFANTVNATTFVKSGGTSAQFLKADGTVDSTTYQGAITLTTTGTSGAATLVGSTLNVPNYADGGVLSLSAIGSTPNANAATITGTVLNLQPADASFGGVVTTGTQTFAGDKTLTGTLYGIGLSMTGTVADIVQGTATSGKALRGTATTGWGLYASATTGVGVQGNSSGTGGSGVYGSSVDGYGGVFYNDSTTYPALEVNNNNESAGNIAVFRRVGTSVFIINGLGNISNGTYTYTLPSATGTLALTSALSGYLPLTGGTLTGNANFQLVNAASPSISIRRSSSSYDATINYNDNGSSRWTVGVFGDTTADYKFFNVASGANSIKIGYGTDLVTFSGNIVQSATNAVINAGTATGSGYFGNLSGGAYINTFGASHATKPNFTEIAGAGGVYILNAATFSSDVIGKRFYQFETSGTVAGTGGTATIAAYNNANFVANTWYEVKVTKTRNNTTGFGVTASLYCYWTGNLTAGTEVLKAIGGDAIITMSSNNITITNADATTNNWGATFTKINTN